MNYSHMITKAFRTLKSGGLWGFVITTQLAVLALFAVGALASLALVGGVAGVTRLSTLSGSSAAASPATWLVLIPIFGIFTLCGLLAIPIALIEYGGLIHLTDEYQAGRSTSVKDGWAFGTRRMGRTLLVDIVVGIVGFAIVLVGTLPSVLAIVGTVRGGQGNGAAIAGSICGASLLLLLMVFALVMLAGFEAIAIRYALIGDRTSGDAIGVGWTAFRARFKNVFLLLLILIGFGLLFGMAQSVVNYFLQFAAIGPLVFALGLNGSKGTGAVFVVMLVLLFLVLYAVALLMAIFMRIFQQALWTSFFRQATGLEPPPQPAYQPPPPGTYYPPPYQPVGPPMAAPPQQPPAAPPLAAAPPQPAAPPAPAAAPQSPAPAAVQPASAASEEPSTSTTPAAPDADA